MPIVTSSYRAPVWLRSGHLQTVLGALLAPPSPGVPRRERLELADGDFLELDWWDGADSSRVAVICHGLEGSSGAGYVRASATALLKEGWSVLAWNFRGCGGVPNRLVRSYHSGGTEDLEAVIRHALVDRHPRRLVVVGFSLGGNLVLKYAGESGSGCEAATVVAISAPVDLASSAKVLDEAPGNRIYLWRFLRTLTGKVRAKSARFPGQIDPRAWKSVRAIREVDEYYTAPVHGFDGAADYWARCSALPLLKDIRVPALLLSARDDPLLCGASYPQEEAEESDHFHLEMPESGGHVAFLGRQNWLSGRIAGFLHEAENRY